MAAGTLLNNPGNLVGWIQNPQNIKPGNLMPNSLCPRQQLSDMLAYLETCNDAAPDYRTPAGVGIDSVEHQARLLRCGKPRPDSKGFSPRWITRRSEFATS